MYYLNTKELREEVIVKLLMSEENGLTSFLFQRKKSVNNSCRKEEN